MKQGDLVEVLWIDSADMGKASWFPEEEYLEDWTIAEIQTVGIYYGENDRLIKIAGSRSTNEGIVTLIRDVIKIPKGCITAINKLNPFSPD